MILECVSKTRQSCCKTSLSMYMSKGELVLVFDDERCENKGDLFLAAKLATPSDVGFTVRHFYPVL